MTDTATKTRLTYWFLNPRDFANEYNVGIATSEQHGEQYKAEGYERIDRDKALARMSRRVPSHEQLFAYVSLNGEQVMDRYMLARALRTGEFRADWPY